MPKAQAMLGTAKAMPVISSATKYSSLPLRLLTSGQLQPRKHQQDAQHRIGDHRQERKAELAERQRHDDSMAPIMTGAPPVRAPNR